MIIHLKKKKDIWVRREWAYIKKISEEFCVFGRNEGKQQTHKSYKIHLFSFFFFKKWLFSIRTVVRLKAHRHVNWIETFIVRTIWFVTITWKKFHFLTLENKKHFGWFFFFFLIHEEKYCMALNIGSCQSTVQTKKNKNNLSWNKKNYLFSFFFFLTWQYKCL